MKRILTVQDISCLGKCSLTIALPVISAMGVETVILPTAVLSTHTMFKGFTVKDLSDQIEPITAHWKKEGVRFDAIYTGYLGTAEEIDAMLRLFEDFRDENTLIFVDPVMGDNGKLYAAFDMDYAVKNTALCAKADVIVPNITEAALMTGMEYRTDYDEAYIREMLEKLSLLGPKTAVLTGVSLKPGKTGVMGLDRETGKTFLYQNDKVSASYHGTGDIFSSVCVGALTNGLPLSEAVKIAADYTALTIRKTLEDPKEPWYGVNFEETLPDLIDLLAAALKSYTF